MIGVSLPLDWLCGTPHALGDTEQVLTELKTRGVSSVELRTVYSYSSTTAVATAAALLWSKGFQITAHVAPKSVESAVSDVFDPLSVLLSEMQQEQLILVLHPIVGDNVSMLRALADHAEKNGYPIRFALENNRLMPDGTEGDSTALVLSVVETINRPDVGICFDMGHYMYFQKRHHAGETACLLPKSFWKYVIHTHIHALNGMTTHFPLQYPDLLLQPLLESLAYGYFGLYNVELDFRRFCENTDAKKALFHSLDALRSSMPVCARLYDDLRDHFDERFLHALTMYDRPCVGTRFALVQSASFLFQTDGFKWGMDIAFRNARRLAETPNRAAELLADLDLMIISHGHSDHFEEQTVRMLANNKMRWILPAFLVEQALLWGIPKEKLIVAHAGEVLCIGPLEILPFLGRHFRPVTGKGLEEYGYHITTADGTSMAFPVDTRDFSLEGITELPEADYCFANVWLGDHNGFAEDYGDRLEDFSNFMLHFSRKNILFAHLYECNRKGEDMWRKEHAELLAQTIRRISPRTTPILPSPGDIITLSPCKK